MSFIEDYGYGYGYENPFPMVWGNTRYAGLPVGLTGDLYEYDIPKVINIESPKLNTSPKELDTRISWDKTSLKEISPKIEYSTFKSSSKYDVFIILILSILSILLIVKWVH